MTYQYLLFLFYGLAFFTLGVTVLFKDKQFSSLDIATQLKWFGLFAISHAFYEWVELYIILGMLEDEQLLRNLHLFKTLLMLLSYTFMMLFGVLLWRKILKVSVRITLFFASVLAVLGFMYAILLFYDDMAYATLDMQLRYFFGFSSSAIAGGGVMVYAHSRLGGSIGGKQFIYSGVVLLMYSILVGIIPSKSVFFGFIRVEFLRGLSAWLMLYFTFKALKVFDDEYKEIIERRLLMFAESEKLNSLGRLASGIAHEINNPLTTVLLNIDLLRNDFRNISISEKILERLSVMDRNLLHAARIARELLDFSREGHIKQEMLNLNDVVNELDYYLSEKYKSYNIIKELNDIPEISGIKYKVKEVLINIILNAIYVTPENGSITIRSYTEASHCCIAVCDNGGGVDEEIIDKVFDPFFTTKPVGEGTGLGLSVCYGIMQKHNGEVILKNSDGGVTVILRFPTTKGVDE